MMFQRAKDPRSVLMNRYIGLQEEGIPSRVHILSLTVWCDGNHQQEERLRIPITPKKGKHHDQIKALAGGLLLGAIVAGGLVIGLLELKASRAEKQANNWLSWPAMSGAERRNR